MGRQCISYGNWPIITQVYLPNGLKPNSGHKFRMFKFITWPNLIMSSGHVHLFIFTNTAKTVHATKTCDTPNDASANMYDPFWVPITLLIGFHPILHPNHTILGSHHAFSMGVIRKRPSRTRRQATVANRDSKDASRRGLSDCVGRNVKTPQNTPNSLTH